MKSGIYTITNLVNGKMYVGCSVDIKKRLRKHRESLERGNHKNGYLQNEYTKYGVETFIFQVLWECEEEFLLSEEHYWATLLNVHNRKFGYNIQLTHPYGCIRHSPETREKISKGRNNGTWVFTEENRINASKRISERGWTPEEIEKRAKQKRIPIICLDLEGNFLKEYESMREAGKDLGICYKHIGQNLRKNILRCKQYIFIYKSEYDENKDYKIKIYNKYSLMSKEYLKEMNLKILEDYENGVKIKEIANKYDICTSTVFSILKKNKYNESKSTTYRLD